MRSVLIAFACGLVFALGLGLSGMVDPRNVLAFLDLAGAWEPNLMLVLGGAVVVYGLGARKVLAWPRPWDGLRFQLPTRRSLDRRLLIGAAMFGVGWGLTGLCPGPALVGVVGGSADMALFAAAMLAGMAGFSLFNRIAPPR
jgi:uncharacterized membrane protein YedE/YeeE